VLSGDTLFVGDIARPDLAVDEQEGAQGIFHSLRDTLLRLPDDCEVWPGHLGGSLCGGPGMDMKVASTIGYERHHQELLAIEDEDEFVARTTTSLGPQPPNFENIVAVNQRSPAVRNCLVLAVAPESRRTIRPHLPEDHARAGASRLSGSNGACSAIVRSALGTETVADLTQEMSPRRLKASATDRQLRPWRESPLKRPSRS
jgi:hypothetical protein